MPGSASSGTSTVAVRLWALPAFSADTLLTPITVRPPSFWR